MHSDSFPTDTTTGTRLEHQEFWDFSVSLYGQPGVEQACLILQDDFGLDVNVVLFCIWYSRINGLLPEPLGVSVFEFAEYWSKNVVQPLRTTRRWMKTRISEEGFADPEVGILREAIKKQELLAEKYQQHHMQSLVTGKNSVSSTHSAGTGTTNLQAYLRWKSLTEEAELTVLFRRILAKLN